MSFPHLPVRTDIEAQQGQPQIMWRRRSASVPAFRSVHAFTHCKYVWGHLCVFAFDLGSVIWMSTTSLKSTSVLSSNVMTPIWVISSLILFSVSMCTAVFLIKNYREKIVLFFFFFFPFWQQCVNKRMFVLWSGLKRLNISYVFWKNFWSLGKMVADLFTKCLLNA